jgi:hypothetical protein
MDYTAKKEILQSLYRYMMFTTKQLAIYLHYPVSLINENVDQLIAQGLVRSMALHFLRKNQVGYILSAYGSKAAASLLGEEEVFRANISESKQLEHIYRSNDFFIGLIKHSLHFKDEGLIEWLSDREVIETYDRIKELKQGNLPLHPDGLGIYLIPGRGKLVFHLEYTKDYENLQQLENKLWEYGNCIPSIWDERGQINVLFISQKESLPERLIKCWYSMCDDSTLNTSNPMVWCISERDWFQTGVATAQWWGAGGKQVRLKDMPLLPLPLRENFPVIGKRAL